MRDATFKEYYEAWLEEYLSTLADSTYEKYYQTLRDHIWPAIGSVALDKINRGNVKALLFKKSKKYTVSIMKDVISGVFEHTLDMEIVTSNPTKRIMKSLKRSVSKKKTVHPPRGIHRGGQNPGHLPGAPPRRVLFFSGGRQDGHAFRGADRHQVGRSGL